VSRSGVAGDCHASLSALLEAFNEIDALIMGHPSAYPDPEEAPLRRRTDPDLTRTATPASPSPHTPTADTANIADTASPANTANTASTANTGKTALEREKACSRPPPERDIPPPKGFILLSPSGEKKVGGKSGGMGGDGGEWEMTDVTPLVWEQSLALLQEQELRVRECTHSTYLISNLIYSII
jgi:hypothetical protein